MPVTPNRRPDAGRQGGFALLVTLLVLIGLSALAGGGLVLARTEAAAARTQAAGVHAYLAAQAATASFLARSRGPLPDTFGVTYAIAPRVTATLRGTRLLHRGPFRRLYRLTATGAYAAGKDGAARTLGLLAVLDGAPLRVPAALTSLGRLEVEGPDVRLDGRGELASDSACAGAGPPAVAGAASSPGGYLQPSGGPLAASGTPDTLSVADDGALASLREEWGELATGEAAYDARLPADPWPVSTRLADGSWTGILVALPEFRADASRSGSGALVVAGDLVLGDGFRWEGLILVGGSLRTEGTATIRGGVVTGAAGSSGGGAPVAHLGPGSVTVRYDACAVARSGRFDAELVPVPGSWSEAFVPGGA